MKTFSLKVFSSIFLIVLLTMTGCEDKSATSAEGTTNGKESVITVDESQYPGTLFPETDEIDLVTKADKTVVQTVSNNAVVTVVPTTGDKVEVIGADVYESTANSYLIFSTTGISTSDIEKPLYIDEIFKGIISDVAVENTNLRVYVKNAENVDDIYSEFTIEMRNDAIRQSVQRSINRHQLKGVYDNINAKSIRFSVIEKSIMKKNGLSEDEIVLRMDIPKGYHAPIRKSVDCSISDADCTFTTSGIAKEKIDLGNSYENAGITFSTEDSYIEMGLGAYFSLHYDKNLFSEDIFDFTVANSGYFKSNMQVSISGKLERSWSTQLKLIKDFDIEIVHPYNLIVKTSIAVAPVFTFGVDGKLEGSITASSYIERSGEIRFDYDSTSYTHDFSSTLAYTPKNLNKDSIKVALKAEGHAYIFPSFLMVPNVKFLRVNIPLTLVYFRSGVKLDNAIVGTIGSGFVVENGAEQKSSDAEASVTTSLYGLVQGRWMVRVGSVDFYHTNAYVNIFKTGTLNVLEWKAQLLHKPQIIVEDDPHDNTVKKITFKADESAPIKAKLNFYYTIADTNEAMYDIATNGIEHHTPVWHIGEAPITVAGNKIVKVRSVLYNKDVSDSIWSWGTSLSEQTYIEIENIIKPLIIPSTTAFTDTLSVNISQAQGYDIYYRVNGDTPQLYMGGITLSSTATIVAYASALLDGVKVFSDEVTVSYTRCEEDEVVVGGTCETYEDPVMLPPTASPMTPEFTDSIDVVLSADADYIVYRLDDGELSIYTGPIHLTESGTIETYADSDPYDADALTSELAIFSYIKVDGSASGSASGVFPSEPFNHLQISYSINGVKLESPKDREGMTVSRTYEVLAKPSGSVTISGSTAANSASCNTSNGSFWFQTNVSLTVGDVTKTFTSPLPCETGSNDKYRVEQPSYSFNLSIDSEAAKSGDVSFSIEQIYVNPLYGNRAVVIGGS